MSSFTCPAPAQSTPLRTAEAATAAANAFCVGRLTAVPKATTTAVTTAEASRTELHLVVWQAAQAGRRAAAAGPAGAGVGRAVGERQLLARRHAPRREQRRPRQQAACALHQHQAQVASVAGVVEEAREVTLRGVGRAAAAAWRAQGAEGSRVAGRGCPAEEGSPGA